MTAVCEACGQPMEDGNGCSVHTYVFHVDAKLRKRIPYGEETHETLRLQRESAPEQARAMEWIGPPADAPWPLVRDALRRYADEHPCPDCRVAFGQYHHPGCDNEECPRCAMQAIGCSCVEQGGPNVPAA